MAAPARILVLCALASFVVACGDFGGGSSGSTSAPQQLLSSAASAGGVDAFSQTLYPILTANCSDCHVGNGPGSPHIAHPSASTAYSNVVNQGKVDLAIPGASRIVQKVGGGHHCWTPVVPVPGQSNCQTNVADLTTAIAEWADIIDFGEGGVSINETLSSNTLRLSDGVEDTQGERYTQNLLALYDFKTGTGTRVFDVSGHPIATDLDLVGDYEWMSGWGVQFNDARAVSVGNSASKLFDTIAAPNGGTGQYTVEAWATNANIVQDGPARIVTYSRNENQRNFALAQNQYNYVFRNRALLDAIDDNGTPALETYDADQDAQDRLQHVVMTFDQFRGRRIYVDGRFTDDVDEQGPGRLWNWTRNGYFLGFGNEVNGSDRHWEGQLRLVAIYSTALTDAQIMKNYQAGVGRRLLLSFDISPWTSPGSTIDYVVTEFDNYSYMFCNPVYQTLNPTEFRLSNIQIAVNGTVATTGQAFQTLDAQVTGPQQTLSQQCAVVPRGPGSDPATDEFTLIFEHLNGFENPIVDDPPGQLIVRMDPTSRPERGLRDFARVNESMAAVTGVDPQIQSVRDTYLELRQQLPNGYDLRTFVSSQQVGIAKLALEYCDQLVEADVLLLPAQRYFGAFPMTSVPEIAFVSQTDRDLLFDTLYDRMIGAGLLEQPTRQGVRDDLDTLVDSLMLECTPGNPCNTTRTLTMMKGVCAAVLSSAAMTIH